MRESNINLKLILQGCRKGNRNSQRKLYEHFYGYSMKICLRYSKSREEAVEILNDAFLKVFRNLDQFTPPNSFQAWLRRILINSAIDYYRVHHKYPAFLELKEAANVSRDEVPLPELLPNEDILPILQKLSPAYRMVFNLFVMEGYKHKEIAKMLDISISTSRSNLQRAKNKLRGLLEEKKVLAVKTNGA